MKKNLPALLFLLCFQLSFSQTVFKNCVDGQIYVKFKNTAVKSVLKEDPTNVPAAKMEALTGYLTRYGITKISRPFYQASDDNTLPYIFKIQFTKKYEVSALITELTKRSDIEFAEKLPILKTDATPNDPIFPPHLTQINATNAWNLFNGNSNITVAVVDDAIMWTHADLIGNIYTNAGEIAGNNIDDDGNGYIDDIHGWDASDLDNNTNPTNVNMDHGTHCSGIAGARTDNAIGVASIGWNIKIIPVKCQTDGGTVATISNGYEGIIYATKAKARVISCSWGSGVNTISGQAVVNYAWNNGCLVVAAAGNANSNAFNYPAACDHVFCVASVESNDVKSSYSNYGTWIDIAAPGSNVSSTVPYTGSTPAYQQLSGTSMATPLVAGLAGLMLSRAPLMTPGDLINCISSSAVNIYGLSGNSSYVSGNQLGAGRIDAFQAMTCAGGFLNLPPIANFFATPIISCSNTPVHFSDSSLYAPTGWLWTFQGGAPATSTLANPVVQWPANGTYSVSLTVTNANGSSTKTKQSYVNITGPIALPLSEGFQSTSFLPVNWTANNILNDEVYWQRKTGIGAYGTSTACAMFDNYDYYTAGNRDEMRTPKYDFSSVASARLKFDVAYARFDAINSDTLEVKMTTNCGASWSTIYIKGGTTLATAPSTGSQFAPTSSQWRTDSIDISATTAGQGNVMFSFINHGQYGQAIYLDNINLSFPEPELAMDLPPYVCVGSAVSFTNLSQGATSYDWSTSGAAAFNSTLAAPSVTYTTPGIQSVILTGANGTATTAITGTIEVISVPSASVNISNASCNTCADGTLQAIVPAGSLFNYSWAPSGGNSAIAQNLLPGCYTVTIDNEGCASIQSACVGIATGLINLTEDKNLKIYPNPATSVLTIEYTGPFSYSLYTSTGQLISQYKSNTTLAEIKLDAFAKGIYVVEIKTGTEILRKKLVID